MVRIQGMTQPQHESETQDGQGMRIEHPLLREKCLDCPGNRNSMN